MFGFDYRIECYTPEADRQYGYYVLPVLRRGEIIGRADAKAHRSAGVFEVKAFYLEDGVRATDAVLRDVARALREAAECHGTPEITLRRTQPRQLRTALKEHIRA